jgi:predicted nuclease of predicted toxin-antitoxin system
LHILLDKNVPVHVRRFLPQHEIRTLAGMQWPERLKNGDLLNMAERAGFDVMVTSDQNIPYQQNLTGRKLALVVLGSNIWRLVRRHEAEIAATVEAATPGSYSFIEVPLPANRQKQ